VLPDPDASVEEPEAALPDVGPPSCSAELAPDEPQPVEAPATTTMSTKQVQAGCLMTPFRIAMKGAEDNPRTDPPAALTGYRASCIAAL
jgi:hypothetical protein